jgi:Alpha/beta hydrolase family
MATKPALLFVHGAWHIPEHYKKLTTKLSEAGFDVTIPHLPTCTNEVPPPHGLEDDCKVVRSSAMHLADQGRSIIVLMHSYGGVVGTDSLKDLSFSYRQSQGLPGGVVRLIYMCAFLLPVNGTLFNGELAPIVAEQPEQETCTMRKPEYHFYDEADGPERQHCMKLLTLHPAEVQKHCTIQYAAYRDIPTTYLVCEQDRALLPEYQKGMIQAAEGPVIKQGEQNAAVETGGVFGGKIHVMTCNGGHSPFLSCPDDVVDCVQQAWKM